MKKSKDLMDDDCYSEMDSSEGHPEKRMACWVKVLIWIGGVLLSLSFLLFVLVFIVFPIVFMLSLVVERLFMFWNIDNPKDPEFGNPAKYGIQGVNNFYLPTNDSDGNGVLSIGVWQILPKDMQHSTETNVEKLLMEEKKYPILLYLHGVACNRILPIKSYQVMREHFHVFAWDYRDNIQIYEWVKKRTNQDIYVWGHSLGSALSIHTVRKLHEERNIVPKGLVIESAFTTMRDEVVSTSIGKFFAWLAYFNATVLDPLEEHGFRFWSTTNIQHVQCPTMHLHAMDDNKSKELMGYNMYSEVDSSEGHPEKRMPCWVKTLIWIGGILVSLSLLLFVLVFIVYPIVFMLSLPVERYYVFMNNDDSKNSEFGNPAKYGIKGVNNFYVPVNDSDGNGVLSIGVWQVLPKDMENSTETNVEKLLMEEKKYPILLYFHGMNCSRVKPLMSYEIVRRHFHVFAVDYRGYGDSSDFVLTESGIIHDNIQVYEWLKERTNQDIYVWGHSLGTSVSVHTVRTLYEEKNIVPKGLVIEAAFPTIREVFVLSPIGKFYGWLAYFNATILDPLEAHGFRFWSTTNIKYVHCPTMHLHAMDDFAVPWTLGEKLKNVALKRPGLSNYTFWHLFSASLGYQHTNILKDPNIPQYIEWFKGNCTKFV
ncbi:unnamed protein product [Brassicogethes aeneus]|uniref:Serine aminopeptidase S33 domain-containing protein n=1 Tax=Brassicogethes aeneus TaxID=1431903 RepID=A0A9P0ATW8_BRAAE|nr:unnamed protein product [Brassicogethes aeneus]